MKGKIRLKKDVLDMWLKGAGITNTQLANELQIDDGNFSKFYNDVIEPSKSFMKKIMLRTGYGFDALFEFDRNATSDENGKQ